MRQSLHPFLLLITDLKIYDTTISSLAASATPQGQLKRAASPCPSAKPSSPLPASVLTSPALDTRRRALFSLSATTMWPAASTVMPTGQLKSAAGPWGASHRRGVTKDPRTHLRKRRGLDLVDDGTRSRGRRGSTLWVFWNKSALGADLRVFERVGCRGLGCRNYSFRY